MTTWAQGVTAHLHQGLVIDLELQLDDLRANASREHQGLEWGQLSDRFSEFAVGLQDASEPSSSALSGRELFIAQTLGLEFLVLFSFGLERSDRDISRTRIWVGCFLACSQTVLLGDGLLGDGLLGDGWCTEAWIGWLGVGTCRVGFFGVARLYFR